MNNLLENLNEAQKKAVLHKNGPLIVLAGAGAGKTRAISHRVAYLASQGVAPDKILAITFTNKAAEEMKERIHNLLSLTGHHSSKPFVSTFHALGVFILRNSGKSVGVPKNFSIFDKEDSLSVIKSVMKDLEIDPKQFQPIKMQSMISRHKGDLMTSEDFSIFAGNEFFLSAVSKIWNKYEENLIKQKALDFDDLILKTALLFKKDKAVADYYNNLWQYILIDEYQDTNKAQYELSKFLAKKHRNICIIGDLDQAIYGWRGADLRNIINFERDFPEHVAIVFEENYRSTQNILEAAARVIEKNKIRKPKNLFTKKEKGAEISLFEAMNEQEEAEFVVHKIKEITGKGANPSDIAVLFRANFQSRILEEFCLKRKVPYQMLGTQFYQRKEIKDIFAYIKAAMNTNDLMSVKRIINVPPRGIGKVTILNYFAGKKLPEETQKKITRFLNILVLINEKIKKEKASTAVRFAIEESGLRDFFQNGSDDDKERMENLKELVTIATRYDGLKPCEGIEKMLTDAALMSEQDSIDRKKNSVRLMTAHSAKGLEFKTVFIVGLEEGLFPHSGWGGNFEEKNEEERRLFYVALTRAQEKLFLSFSVSRMIYGSKQLNLASRFLSDIPEHLVKLEEFCPGAEDVIEYD
ncbi:UvrD-helicase domain-containing protein [Patescibacteria group bacterium]|nr:UvrD-helicase domain-containing protein [Patescibacteria group bacterium]MBU4353091.1 UvrD-helicase domain-containing protein [Patescibacteria group bacterium]MBU4477411.1 UvrD-helicase domain-containing protein [Patescibacteria group bacterium]MCG2699426.1 exodeoxyribonuclease V subunit gamma [Candidatus Parcubacteria bacterium]